MCARESLLTRAKQGRFVLLLAATFTACGGPPRHCIVCEYPVEEDARVAADTLDQAVQSALDASELAALGNGVDALGGIDFSLPSIAVAAAPTASPESPFLPMGSDTLCNDPKGGPTATDADGICYLQPQIGAKLTLYFSDPAVLSSVQVVGFHHESVLDGRTRTHDIYDRAASADATVAEIDLFRHDVDVVGVTEGGTHKGLARRTEVVRANFHGLPDPEAARRPALADMFGNATDEFFAFAVTSEFNDGLTVREFGVPAMPLNRPEDVRDVRAGTYRRETTFPADHRLSTESITVVFDKDAGTGRAERTTRTREGATLRSSIVYAADGTVTIHDERPDGAVVDGQIDLNSGAFSRTIRKPDGKRRLIEESGTLTATEVTLERTIQLDDGTSHHESVHVVRQTDRTVVEIVRDGGPLQTVTIEPNASGGRTFTGSMTDKHGASVEFQALDSGDGTLEINLWIDRPQIDGDLDEGRAGDQDAVAFLTRDATGRLTGVAQLLLPDGRVHEMTIDVTQTGGPKIHDLGPKPPRPIARDLGL